MIKIISNNEQPFAQIIQSFTKLAVLELALDLSTK